MASVLYQSIELLSQEKGIDPAIVVGAVEEAIALATRKFYKTQENMRGELNKETGQITAYIYKTVVADDEPLEDPLNQITLTEAKALAPEVEVGSEMRFYRDTSRWAASPRNWPSRSSSKRSARPSATPSSTSTPTAKRKC
jgi:N utilization substance protein A